LHAQSQFGNSFCKPPAGRSVSHEITSNEIARQNFCYHLDAGKTILTAVSRWRGHTGSQKAVKSKQNKKGRYRFMEIERQWVFWCHIGR